MSSPEPGVRVEAIRNAAAEAVKAASLRSVAAEIGMSPTNLRHFLNGQEPYSVTLRKLIPWYLTYHLRRKTYPTEAARAAVAVLLEAIPDADLERARAALAEWLRGMHRERRVLPPAWLDQLPRPE